MKKDDISVVQSEMETIECLTSEIIAIDEQIDKIISKTGSTKKHEKGKDSSK